MKYGKALLFVFIPSFIFGLIMTILYYFNIINSNVFNILSSIIFIIFVYLSSIYVSKNSSPKWKDGLKFGGLLVAIFLLLNIIFIHSLNIRSFIYYLIIMFICFLGSNKGFKNKKTDK